MKRILINSSYGDELRVALVDGAKLYDFDTESPDKVLLKEKKTQTICMWSTCAVPRVERPHNCVPWDSGG